MTNINQIDINATTTSEQSVYSKFPTCLHKHVEHELFYKGVELEEGEITIEEFTKGVLSTASSHEQWQAQLEQDKAIFAGIKNLIIKGRSVTRQWLLYWKRNLRKVKKASLHASLRRSP